MTKHFVNGHLTTNCCNFSEQVITRSKKTWIKHTQKPFSANNNSKLNTFTNFVYISINFSGFGADPNTSKYEVIIKNIFRIKNVE